jgi:predicted NodU family carbamoyl transferase
VNFLSYNPGHDGAIAFLQDAHLLFSIEAEKDSNYRYSAVGISDVLNAAGELGVLPDVICMGGWWMRDHHEYLHGSLSNAGYRGVSTTKVIMDKGKLLRGRTDYFSSSHERSHILCAFGMSAFPLGTECYALVWEGELGSFYEIDSKLNIKVISEVLGQPGHRYGLLYGLADPTFPKDGPYPRPSDAGKLMAVASFAKRSTASELEKGLLRFLLDGPYRKLSDYDELKNCPHLNAGVEDPEFRNFAGIYSDAIFEMFHQFAKTNLVRGRPLVIAGGCGLNCDWNTKWKESGLFSEVFVPPVANDSGSAIGTAIDAQFFYTGTPKIEWDVYSGLVFHSNGEIDFSKYDVFDVSAAKVADMLANDLILGWVSGRYEIGPRALGNRSILAAPFKNQTRTRLNQIKKREQFRPIAPVCLEDDAQELFGCNHASPYMLYTYRATANNLCAVTHINNTARIQTVTSTSNEALYDLLSAFKVRTGFGVLCNTSLNFTGKGFINNLVDLDTYAVENGLDGFVVEGRAYLLKRSSIYQEFKRAAGSHNAH